MSAFSTNLQAAINEIYGTPEEVADENLDEKAKESQLLEWIVKSIYYVASWIEDTVGGMFEGLTGTNEFPWADRVIFNAVPFLDVNFLNPEPGSLFLANNNQTALAGVIVKIYGSLMTLSIGFLGVAVGVISIKLAISTVASEKAKYKKSIVKFFSSIVLLFCVHYIIALVFYVNERLVETASAILVDTVTELGMQNNLDLSNKLNKDTLVSLYVQANTVDVDKDSDYTEDEFCAFTRIEPFSTSFQPVLKGYNSLKLSSLPFKNVTEASTYIEKNSEIAASLIREFKDTRYGMAYSSVKDSSGFWKNLFSSGDIKKNKRSAIGLLAFDIWIVKGGKSSEKDSVSAGVQNYIDNEVKKYLEIFANKTDEKIAQEYINKLNTVLVSKISKHKDSDEIEYEGIYAGDGIISTPSYSGYKKYADELKTTDFVFISQSIANGEFYIGDTICYNLLFDCRGLGDLQAYELEDVLKTDWDNEVGPTFLVSAEGKNLTYESSDGETKEVIVYIDDDSHEYPFTTDLDTIKRFVSKWRNSSKTKYYEKIYNMYSHYALSSDDENYVSNVNDNVFSIITSLATYFKDAVWGYEVNSNGDLIGWRQNNFTVSGAIIYCIFLVQSLIFFIAYIKRFFYVTILAMFAPVVVLYNFMFGGL